MATKMCFLVDENCVFQEKIIEFEYIKGMAFSQKQKNVRSFHSAIQKIYPNKKILEISTKSEQSLGVKLSAFNLKLNDCYIESIFQSSKIFEGNTQYAFLQTHSPKEAKKYIESKKHSILIGFKYNGIDYPIEPKSLFYDFIYISSLIQNHEISKELMNYDIFTDIEFNEKKQINSQARSCAIYSFLLRHNMIDFYMSSIDNFKLLYTKKEKIQLSLFD